MEMEKKKERKKSRCTRNSSKAIKILEQLLNDDIFSFNNSTYRT